MPDGAERFWRRFPVVWHVVEAAGLDGVRQHGLLPANALRDLAGTAPDAANRDDFVSLALPQGMAAVLRFQQMADARLTPTLHGAYAGRPDRWRAMIDSNVFFWTTAARRDAFRAASARQRARSSLPGDDRPSVVLAFDTRRLLAAHLALAAFSRINSGTTQGPFYARTWRDECTFRPVAAYRSGQVAELTIAGRVRLQDGQVSTEG